MEVTELTRHSNLDLYCPTYNRFSGKYYAIKFGVIGGGSICDISKEITVKDGSVIHMVVAGHRNGNMIVNQPNGEKKQLSQKGLLEYMFLGNESGNWRFAVRGWSIYFRMAIVLFYIDIDPYVRNK
jgi:hypothetical protein